MNKIEIILLGNRGVGKTTLLSVLSHVLQDNQARFSPLFFRPKGEEFKQLDELWDQLIEKLNENYFFTDQYAGTPEIIEHDFEYCDDKGHSLPCCFVDTPGGLSKAGGDNTNLPDRVAKAKALICVVDAVDLMEYKENELAKSKCAVAGIQQLLTAAKGEKPLHCLFVLTKCEKYMHSRLKSKNADALARRFTECFSSILTLPNLTSYYLPVETFGCFEFAGIVKESHEGKEIERRKWDKVKLKYSPKNVCYPLLYVMKELLADLKKQTSFWENFWDWFTGNSDFDNYVKKLEKFTREEFSKNGSSELRKYDQQKNELVKIDIQNPDNQTADPRGK